MELITCSTEGESKFLSHPALSLRILDRLRNCLLFDNLNIEIIILTTWILRKTIFSPRLPACLPGHRGQPDGAQRGAGDSPRALCEETGQPLSY